MKKLLAILAALVLLLSACALAEESHKSGNWEYRLLDDGTAEIIKYNGKAKTLEIPSQLDGYSVTAIGAGAFAWYGRLTSITIPDSVKDVGANPFLNCNKLTKINVSQENEYLAVIDGVLFSKPDRRLVCCPTTKTGEYAIPQGICIIGEYSFCYCNRLINVIIPDSVTSIGQSAFYECSNLTSVTIPDSVTSIGDSAYAFCGRLTSVNIPGSVTSIGDYAFCCCEDLTEVTISDNVKYVGKNPFEGNDKLAKIRVSQENEYLAVIDGILISKPDMRLVYCPTNISGEYVIPQGICVIGDRAFSWCTSLTSVTIPDSVTSIGNYAFGYCKGLTSITIPASVMSIGNDAFEGCSKKLLFIVEKGSYVAGYCKENGIEYQYVDAFDWLKD